MNDLEEELEKRKPEAFSEVIEAPIEGIGIELPNTPIGITDDNFDYMVQNYGFLTIGFCIPNHRPCGRLSLIVEKLAKEYQGKVVFGMLNINESKRVNSLFNISILPTLLFIKDGTLVDKVAGDIPEKVIEHKIRYHLGIF